jgi:hypothetical protein
MDAKISSNCESFGVPENAPMPMNNPNKEKTMERIISNPS